MSKKDRSVADEWFSSLVRNLVDEYMNDSKDEEQGVTECQEWILTYRKAPLIGWFMDTYQDWAELGFQNLHDGDTIFMSMILGCSPDSMKTRAHETLLGLVTEDYHDLRHEIQEIADGLGILGSSIGLDELTSQDARDRANDMRRALA